MRQIINVSDANIIQLGYESELYRHNLVTHAFAGSFRRITKCLEMSASSYAGSFVDDECWEFLFQAFHYLIYRYIGGIVGCLIRCEVGERNHLI